jgi:hypothetical protein
LIKEDDKRDGKPPWRREKCAKKMEPMNPRTNDDYQVGTFSQPGNGA